MNFYKARQRQSDQKWDFTCYNDNQHATWRVGTCDLKQCNHETSEEAQECYRQFLLGELKLEARNFTPWHVCDVVGCDHDTNTTSKASNYFRWALCDKHRTREVVEGLLDVFEFLGSY